MMKWILLTSLFPNDVKPDNGLFNLARVKALVEKGNDVAVIAPIDLTPHMRYLIKNHSIRMLKQHWLDLFSIRKFEQYEGIRVHHPQWYSPPRAMFWKDEYKWFDWYCSRQINDIMKREKPDAVICSWLSPFGIYAKYIKEKHHIPVFVIPEGDDLLIYPDQYDGWNNLRGILNQYADRIICSSKYMYDHAQNRRGLLHAVQINNGYDHDLFKFEGITKTDSGIKLLSVGYLDHVKGQDILLRAMAQLGNGYELTLVGDGALKNELQQLARSLGLQNRVKFVGFQAPQKLASFYHNADIFCLASRSEGFGISILEAMACGLPVIGSNVGGIPEKIREGQNGFTAEKENPTDFVEKIRKASQIEWDHLKIAEAVRVEYGWGNWAEQMMNEFVDIEKES
ncbi:MAG TPA: glycosyltransferase [Candidatus Cloacimonadota bacterium]|nr:glycosyltransferase [Candidatus Cloacimonadota bacterium]HPT71814.1 glycosyltransferase [Candidatus Cloacimonadota bacterium]